MPLNLPLRIGLLASVVIASASLTLPRNAHAAPSQTEFTPVGGGISPSDMASIRHDLDQQLSSASSAAPAADSEPVSEGLNKPAKPVGDTKSASSAGKAAGSKTTGAGSVVSSLRVPAPLPDASGDHSQPEMTQLYDEKKRPYYYDRQHEFHPGTVPVESPAAAAITADPFSKDDSITFADAGHSSGSINAGAGYASQGDSGGYYEDEDGPGQNSGGQASQNGGQAQGQNGQGQNNRRRVPTDSEGRPMTPYYGDDPREDKKAELNEVLNHLLPPDDAIIAMRRKRAAAQQADVMPLQKTEPVIRTINLTLSPGETPPPIHMSYGNGTSITFSDIAGNPWYVRMADADKMSYSTVYASGDSDTKSNIVTLTPKKEFSQGRNMTVFLDHLPVPVIFQLDTGISQKIDYRIDVSIRHRGPLTKDAIVETGIAPPQDKVLQSFVDGLTPDHAVKLKTSNQNVEAWRIGKTMYIRSPMPLRGPRYTKRSQSNIDGVIVYEVQYTPDIMMSDNGELIPVRVGK